MRYIYTRAEDLIHSLPKDRAVPITTERGPQRYNDLGMERRRFEGGFRAVKGRRTQMGVGKRSAEPRTASRRWDEMVSSSSVKDSSCKPSSLK